MPSVSKKQARFMSAAAHNPKFAKKAGIKQSVARDFNKADQGALKRATGGTVRRAPPASIASVSPQGALGRAVSRISPQSQKNPSAMKGNHMMRNAGPIKPETLSSTDSTLAETGEGLRKIVGRMNTRGRVAAARGGKIRKYAEGGKVGTAMSALRALAKKYQEALDSGDTMLARRLKKQMDSAGVQDPEEKIGNEKAATFAKGGKVKALTKVIRARMDDLEGYIREGVGSTREEARANLRKEVAKDNGEDVVDSLLKEHGVTYNRSEK